VASDIPPSNFSFLFFQFLLLFLSVSERLDERLQFGQMRLENGRDGALRRPPARAFPSPAGRLFKASAGRKLGSASGDIAAQCPYLFISKRLDERLQLGQMRLEKFLVMLPAADSAFIDGVFVPIPSAILVFALSVSIRG